MKTAYDMQEIQKATCSSCGTTFVAESATAKLCPSCASKQEHHQHSGCGCGHWLSLCPFFVLVHTRGMFLWVVYGIIRSDPVIIGTNATGFALNITLLIMKLRYDKLQSSTIKTSKK
jgi:predicted RNA-binding Zn-ribbon protein involved in translation (DUF1610 family)